MGNCLRHKDQYEYEVQTMMTGFNGDDIKVDVDCSHAMNQIIQEEFQDENFKSQVPQPSQSFNVEAEKKQ